LMEADDISETIQDIRYDVLNELIDSCIPPQSIDEQWNVPGLEQVLETEFGITLDLQGWLDADSKLDEEGLRKQILEAVEQEYVAKEQQAGSEILRHFEKATMLQVLDTSWKEHLAAMDYLRQGIHLRGYAQKNPTQEFKRESFELFNQLLGRIKQETIALLSKVQVRAAEDVAAVEEQRRQQGEMSYQHAQASALDREEEPPPEQAEGHTPFVREGRKVGRNEPCPCGSGKKYKQCHGKLN